MNRFFLKKQSHRERFKKMAFACGENSFKEYSALNKIDEDDKDYVVSMKVGDFEADLGFESFFCNEYRQRDVDYVDDLSAARKIFLTAWKRGWLAAFQASI